MPDWVCSIDTRGCSRKKPVSIFLFVSTHGSFTFRGNSFWLVLTCYSELFYVLTCYFTCRGNFFFSVVTCFSHVGRKRFKNNSPSTRNVSMSFLEVLTCFLTFRGNYFCLKNHEYSATADSSSALRNSSSLPSPIWGKCSNLYHTR